MTITIIRKFKKQDYTIGSLFIDPSNTAEQARAPFRGVGGLERGGGLWFCNTLEPPIGTLTESISAGSGKAIPTGRFRIRMVWSSKFKQVLPWVENVLGRSGILIHAGNSVADTHGCILVGRNTQPGRLVDSRATLAKLIPMMTKAIARGEEVMLEVRG